jgi:hypothetical protein
MAKTHAPKEVRFGGYKDGTEEIVTDLISELVKKRFDRRREAYSGPKDRLADHLYWHMQYRIMVPNVVQEIIKYDGSDNKQGIDYIDIQLRRIGIFHGSSYLTSDEINVFYVKLRCTLVDNKLAVHEASYNFEEPIYSRKYKAVISDKDKEKYASELKHPRANLTLRIKQDPEVWSREVCSPENIYNQKAGICEECGGILRHGRRAEIVCEDCGLVNDDTAFGLEEGYVEPVEPIKPQLNVEFDPDPADDNRGKQVTNMGSLGRKPSEKKVRYEEIRRETGFSWKQLMNSTVKRHEYMRVYENQYGEPLSDNTLLKKIERMVACC